MKHAKVHQTNELRASPPSTYSASVKQVSQHKKVLPRCRKNKAKSLGCSTHCISHSASPHPLFLSNTITPQLVTYRTSIMERSSSFSRSFYSDNSNNGGDDDAGAVAPSIPRSRPLRRQSSRRSSRNINTGAASGTAAPPSNKDEPMEVAATRPASSAKRTESWYQEALQQGSSEQELKNMMVPTSSNNPSQQQEDGALFGGFDDDEVLEQYRIMAQHEANLRVKENTGFDVAEYEKRRKSSGGDPKDKKDLYGGGKKPKLRLPEYRSYTSSLATPKPEEPPVPIPKLQSEYLERIQPRVAQLCTGERTNAPAGSVEGDRLVVRCLGCKCYLRVKIVATLASCPDCHTVSPASSTRR